MTGAGPVFTNSTVTYTLNSSDSTGLTGTVGLTKNGAGILNITGANTFSGLTTVSSGTLTLTNALALQNSALVTTTGTSTISGVTSLTLGGLSGSRDLGSANVLSGFTGSVTSLTLNPLSGSVTYSGVIANGSTPFCASRAFTLGASSAFIAS